jgi:hypothetical protein
MGDTLRRVLCGPSKARKPAVRSTVVAREEKPLPTPPNASAGPVPQSRPGLGNASTRDHCACGRFYETADGAVWQELRGGHLRCFCGGCA